MISVVSTKLSLDSSFIKLQSLEKVILLPVRLATILVREIFDNILLKTNNYKIIKSSI